MLTKLPLLSMTTSQPLWLDDGTAGSYPNNTIHRGDYRGHVHASRRIGHGRLTAPSSKPKVSAYLSTINLAPEKGPGRYAPRQEPCQIQRYWTRRGNIAMETDSMQKSTSYKDEYIEKQPEIREAYKPCHHPLTSDETFSSKSTYKADFPFHPSPRRDGQLQTSGVPSCRLVFWPKPDTSILEWQDDERRRPSNQPVPTDAMQSRRKPFARDTSYRTQYQPYEVYQAQKPILPVQLITTCSEPFKARTNYQDNYIPKELPLEERTSNRHLACIGYTDRPGVTMPKTPTRGEWYQTERLMPYLEHDRSCFYVAPVQE